MAGGSAGGAVAQSRTEKLRLPFALETLYRLRRGLQQGLDRVRTRLVAFLDDASRVCCHGQFFPAENVDTLIEALRAAFYKHGVGSSQNHQQHV